MRTSAPARYRRMSSARVAFALGDLEGLTVESFEDSVPASRRRVVWLFLCVVGWMRTWTMGYTEREREFGVTDQMPAAGNPHFARSFTALQTPNQFFHLSSAACPPHSEL